MQGYDRAMYYFKELSKIPRGSKNCKGVGDFLVSFAKEKNLRYYRDEKDNVVIYKEGKGKSVILQGHTDMVCEAVSGCSKDFLSEGIDLVEKDGFLSAKGTTLGADDGSAVAIMLAILEENDRETAPVEAVFTTDEEIGLLGAVFLDKSVLSSKLLLNIDSEEEGVMTAGCAGGRRVNIHLPIEKTKKQGTLMTILIDGLIGGHSGVEIDKNRANADKLLGKILRALSKEGVMLVSAEGGTKDNAIVRTAEAKILVPEGDFKKVQEICGKYETLFKKEFSETDPDLFIKAEENEKGTFEVFSPNYLSEILCALPFGVMNKNSEGEVLTSLNIGILHTEENEVFMGISVRSNINGEKEALSDRLHNIAKKYGATSDEEGDYPGWEYNEKSILRDVVRTEYEKQTGKKMQTVTIHAGLECGLFAKEIKDFDGVSIGPTIYDIHTPDERMDLGSFERTYYLVKGVVKALSRI